jgi:hypothetical protein
VALFFRGLAVLALSRRRSGSLRKDPVWTKMFPPDPLPFREGGAQIACPTSGRGSYRGRGLFLENR